MGFARWAGRLWPALVGLVWLLLAAAPALAQEVPKRINAHLENEIIPLNSNATTVSGFLDELSINLPPEALIDPPLDSAIRDGMNVFMTSLSVTRGETTEPIPVETEIVESYRFGPVGMELLSPGRSGLRRVSCTIFYCNGEEVGRRQRVEVLRPMKPMQIIYYDELNEADGPSAEQILELRMKPGAHHIPPTRYKRELTMTATAYEPGPQSCGRFASGCTAVGYKAGYGVVAVDSKVIPMHARLFIEGYGYAIAGDRGSAIRGNRIDLGFLTVDECYEFGRREVKVYELY